MIKKLLPFACLLILVFSMNSYGFQDDIAAKLKEVPAGQTVLDFIAALNSGEIEQMRAFHRSHGGQIGLAGQDLEFSQQSGGVTPVKVTKLSDSNIALLVRTKKDSRWLIIEFEIGEGPSFPLLGLDLRPGPAPGTGREKNTTDESPAEKKVSETEAVSMLEKRLGQMVGNDRFSGVVLIAKGGKPVFQKAYGMADKEKGEPNQMDTKFNLGSINKIFTRIAIAGLIEQGKLSIDDKLGEFLPEYPNKEAREKVTVGQLLEMRSGIGDFFNERYDAAPKDEIRSLKDYLPFFADKPLEFEPGTGKRYSNGGYLVLGLIIEKVSGMDYYAYVNKNIFVPSGMNNTASFATYEKIPRLARGYTTEGVKSENTKSIPGQDNPAAVKRVENTKSLPGRGSSAGGGYSTALDMLRFANALKEGKLRTDPKSKQFTGIGIAGGAPGISSVLEAAPDPGYTIIVMSNYDPPTAEDVGRFARKLFGNVPD